MLSDNSHVTFRLHLGADDVEMILEALAELPFKRVFACIAQLNEQAVRAFPAHTRHQGVAASTAAIEVNAEQMRLMLEVLPQLSYQRVHRLLQGMHRQLLDAKGVAA